jgi:8-oxo-dGTP pyrophosphatase MutT (NUDIX family)
MDDVSQPIRQAAVIAIHNGRVCLVSSRSGRRWVVPKGMIEIGCLPSDTALAESWEEAGLTGELSRDPVGSFEYEKNSRVHVVAVYLLIVRRIAAVWPEQSFRRRIWLDPIDAAGLVEEAGLKRLLRELGTGAAIA